MGCSRHTQEVESWANIEARFEELQIEARRSDSVGQALEVLTQFLRSNVPYQAAASAVQKSVSIVFLSCFLVCGHMLRACFFPFTQTCKLTPHKSKRQGRGV